MNALDLKFKKGIEIQYLLSPAVEENDGEVTEKLDTIRGVGEHIEWILSSNCIIDCDLDAPEWDRDYVIKGYVATFQGSGDGSEILITDNMKVIKDSLLTVFQSNDTNVFLFHLYDNWDDAYDTVKTHRSGNV